ncbi:50S ribosomal protein L10 [Thermodesulfobacteriota bacterium]
MGKLNQKSKEQIVTDIQQAIDGAEMIMLTDFRGLDAESMNVLRNKVRETSSQYLVIKNTLAKIAVKDTEYSVLNDHFTGPTALLFTHSDPVASSKAVLEFVKDNPDLEIKLGYLQGEIIQSDKIKELSQLPGKEALLGRLLGSLIFTPQGLLTVLTGVQRKFVGVIDAIRKSREEQ